MKYSGNIPKGEEWELVDEILFDGGLWSAYQKQNGNGWRTMKVCSQKTIETKANYWLGVCNSTGKIAQSKDAKLLKQNRKGLYKAIEGLIK